MNKTTDKAAGKATPELNRYSKQITQSYRHPAARAMLFGAGLSESDMELPQVGVISSGYEGNPCNMHLNALASAASSGARDAKMVGFVANTIGVSDGISMGTFGMRYSLPSREIIADSIETIASADGVIVLSVSQAGVSTAVGRR
jgi:dihydroxy-acid dehydratase